MTTKRKPAEQPDAKGWLPNRAAYCPFCNSTFDTEDYVPFTSSAAAKAKIALDSYDKLVAALKRLLAAQQSENNGDLFDALVVAHDVMREVDTPSVENRNNT